MLKWLAKHSGLPFSHSNFPFCFLVYAQARMNMKYLDTTYTHIQIFASVLLLLLHLHHFGPFPHVDEIDIVLFAKVFCRNSTVNSPT